jgi:hypothetical protein
MNESGAGRRARFRAGNPGEQMSGFVRRRLRQLQPYAARPWFPPVMATSAAADYVFFAASPQLLLIASVLLRGPRWRVVPWLFAAASALGAIAVTLAIAVVGEALVTRLAGGEAAMLPGRVAGFIDHRGLIALGILCALPLPMRSPVFLAALAGMPAAQVGVAVFAGRLVACHLIAIAAALAPARLARVPRLSRFFGSLGVTVPGAEPAMARAAGHSNRGA